MASTIQSTVAAPTSISVGTPTAVGTLNGFTVSLENPGTATYQLQVSLDPSSTPAATSWINEQAALTAAGAVQVTKQAMWVRWNCTAYTNGTPTSHLVGLNRT